MTRLFGLGLYPSQKFAEIHDPVKREEILKCSGPGVDGRLGARQPFFWGEYDLSEEKVKDSVGIKPQN